MFCNITAQRIEKRCYAFYLARVQTCMATNQGVGGCEYFLQEVESSSAFCDKICTCFAFTGPRQTWFAASDLTPLYGVTPAQFNPIRSQYSDNLQQPDLLQDRYDYGVIKCATWIFNSFCSNVEKQVVRFFFCSFYRSLNIYKKIYAVQEGFCLSRGRIFLVAARGSEVRTKLD